MAPREVNWSEAFAQVHSGPMLRTFFALGALGAALANAGCTLVKNYDDPNGPRYAGSYSSDPGLSSDAFTLTTFNVEFGKKVDQAVVEFRNTPELADAAVILLQEMDAPGVDRAAQALGYDYVYYPGSVHDGQDLGEAVLSRWPIVSDRKLILPHRNPTNGRIRLAVGATLATPDGELEVFSVHSDTPWLGPEARLEQAQAVIDAAASSATPVAIGGDFNTLEGEAVRETIAEFSRAGYACATEALPASTESSIGKRKLDHVFVRGLAGIFARTQPTEASDHQPVWVRLEEP